MRDTAMPCLHRSGLIPLALAAALSAPAALAELYGLPLFLSETAQGQEGVLRVQSLSDEPGTVDVYAVDDSGTRSGPASFTLASIAAAEFDATDPFSLQSSITKCQLVRYFSTAR